MKPQIGRARRGVIQQDAQRTQRRRVSTRSNRLAGTSKFRALGRGELAKGVVGPIAAALIGNNEGRAYDQYLDD